MADEKDQRDQQEVDGYDEAWNEGETDAAPGAGPDSAARADGAATAGGQTGDEDGDGESQDQGRQQSGTGAGATGEAAAEPGPPAQKAEDSQAGAVDVNKELQRLRSWTGRINKGPQTEKTAQELAAISERIAALEASTKVKPTKDQDTGAAPGPGQKETAAEAKAIDAAIAGMSEEEESFLRDTLGDDGDDFRKAIGLLLKKALPSLLKPLQEEIAPLKDKLAPIEARMSQDADRAVEEAERVHFAPVLEAHPDYVDIMESGDFDEWVSKLPARDKLWAKYVDARGTSAEIVDLISQYKTDRGIGSKQPENKTVPAQDQKRDRKAQDAAAVRGRGAGPPPSKASKDDYDAAWDEEDD